MEDLAFWAAKHLPQEENQSLSHKKQLLASNISFPVRYTVYIKLIFKNCSLELELLYKRAKYFCRVLLQEVWKKTTDCKLDYIANWITADRKQQ